MAKLTDLQRKQLIADRINGASIRILAAKYKISTTSVQKVLKSDTDLTQKLTDKKEENTQAVLSYMDEKKEDVCLIIGKILDEIGKKDRIAAAPLNQLATTLGILVDKFTVNENKGFGANAENNLFDVITEAMKGSTNNDIQNTEPEAAENAPLVDNAGDGEL